MFNTLKFIFSQTFKQSWPLLLVLLIVPAFLPLLFSLIILYAQTPVSLLKIMPVEIPNLP